MTRISMISAIASLLIVAVCASTVVVASSHSSAHASAIHRANEQYSHLHSLTSSVGDVAASLSNIAYTPSATPLIVLSPEVSIWSPTNNLIDSDTIHWAGQRMTIAGAIRIDGATYPYLGNAAEFVVPNNLTQVNKIVMPTSTYYSFIEPVSRVVLNVLMTSVVDQLSNETESSKPYAYVTLSVHNNDTARAHSVEVFWDTYSDWVLDVGMNGGQNIGWADISGQDPNAWVCNTIRNYDNIPFSEKGDGIKMNWGSLFHASPADARLTHTVAESHVSRLAFVAGQPLPPNDAAAVRAWNDRTVSSSFVWNFGSLAVAQQTGAFMMIGYDDGFSQQYFGERQVPLWRHTWGGDLRAMILDGLGSFLATVSRTNAFDLELFKSLQSSGGAAYAILAMLAYRQVTGGIKATWSESAQESRWYMKEISSDGDVSTVDVVYPASPFFLLFAPELLRKILLPIMMYGNNETDIAYNLPWAPHHLGAWPVSDITPGQQEQMPMEESGNLLLMIAGIAGEQGSVAWLAPYWPLLATWASYLESSLPDPGNQLCTDDFEGPSPHNSNLALKGIVALGAYSQLLALDGQVVQSQHVRASAQVFVGQWLSLSGANDSATSHSRLQYNLPGTWSQKYNLLYQYILELDLFPPSVMLNEQAFYATQLTDWGLPLDSRGPLSKTDWSSWMGAMSSDLTLRTNIFDRLLNFALSSPSIGVPFSDFYSTQQGNVLGFRARPVQGGLFANMLLTSKKITIEAKDAANNNNDEYDVDIE